jgi:hypothetical protein
MTPLAAQGCNSERLMDADEGVESHVQVDGDSQMLEFLRERIGKPGEAPQVHSHAEILPLHVAGADVGLVGIAADRGSDKLDFVRRAVPPRSAVVGCRIDFDQLSEVKVGPEAFLKLRIQARITRSC